MTIHDDGRRLVLPGVTHNLEVRDMDGSMLLRAWSPAVLSGDWAEAVLSEEDRRELAAYLLTGLKPRVKITDDGEEIVRFKVDGKVVATVEHGPHGWDGMSGAIHAVESVLVWLGVAFKNKQDIV